MENIQNDENIVKIGGDVSFTNILLLLTFKIIFKNK
ncbi:unnamed protein product [Thelazia callipaeda]|uniref:Uncharacterized protein n=1 Tax=Thelazia callipaeda TaxID=103827 RepID=A0A0N5DAS9_THECL|nr:unnamed protein product [Thelazia callipaeda]